MDEMQSPALLVAISIAIAMLVASTIARITAGSLALLPGTRMSRWTSLPLRWATIRGQRHHYVHDLHNRYGSIVRLAPNEVSVIDGPTVKQMYRMGSKFWKSPWYLDFTGNTQAVTLFATLNDADHSKLRKLVANNFAEKSIRSFEPDVAEHSKLTVQMMEKEMKILGHVDVFKWFVFMANDIICRASFVDNFELVAGGKKTDYSNEVLGISRSSMVRSQSRLLNAALSYLFPRRYGSALRAVSRLELYSSQSLDRYRVHVETNPYDARVTLLSRMFDNVQDGLLTFDQIRIEGVSYIIAGTETTAVTATYVVWFLSQFKELEREVIEEVASLSEDFTHEQLAKLSSLCNTIDEVLRLRTPVSQSLPRVTPPGGLKIGEFFVPGGVEIGAPSWTLHRKPATWRDPDIFRPERWKQSTKEMRDNFTPFGGGSRVCLGIHLAYMELRYVLANFYRTFSAGVEPSTSGGFSDSEMETQSYFVILPKGKRCLVQCRT